MKTIIFIRFTNKDGERRYQIPDQMSLVNGINAVIAANIGDLALRILSIEKVKGNKTIYL